MNQKELKRSLVRRKVLIREHEFTVAQLNFEKEC